MTDQALLDFLTTPVPATRARAPWVAYQDAALLATPTTLTLNLTTPAGPLPVRLTRHHSELFGPGYTTTGPVNVDDDTQIAYVRAYCSTTAASGYRLVPDGTTEPLGWLHTACQDAWAAPQHRATRLLLIIAMAAEHQALPDWARAALAELATHAYNLTPGQGQVLAASTPSLGGPVTLPDLVTAARAATVD